MVVHGGIKILTVKRVARVVILRAFDIEVGNPPKLTVYISVLRNRRVVRHPSSLDLILFVWIEFSAGLD